MNVKVDMEWRTLGAWKLGKDGDLVFPSDTPDVPGVYRFRLEKLSHYIGETQKFRASFLRFNMQVKSQVTNMRIGEKIKEHLESGGVAEIYIISEGVTLIVRGKKKDVDLSNGKMRIALMEYAMFRSTAMLEKDLLNP